MRFPDLPGYRYEGFLGEDPFGWSFVALHESGTRRAVRVFKAQSTSDWFLYPYFKTLSDPANQLNGVARIHDFVLQSPIALTACVDNSFGVCESESACPVRGRWDPVNEAIRRALTGISIADLAGPPAVVPHPEPASPIFAAE